MLSSTFFLHFHYFPVDITQKSPPQKLPTFGLDQKNELLERLEDESDIREIRDAKSEPLYDQEEAESYIFMNPVKRERLEKGWTQEDLAERVGVKQSTIAKWEREGAVYRKHTRIKLANVFGANEDIFR
jgi:ribosome-binding protein aMBF1 (putative translation factor)